MTKIERKKSIHPPILIQPMDYTEPSSIQQG